MLWLSQLQKIGVVFTAGGVFFFIMGVLSLFSARLLAMGNVLFVLGVVMIIGPTKTLVFFTRPQKLRGSICFIIGLLLIFMKRSFWGFLCEMVGVLGLFGEFFPVLIQFLRSLPFIGPLLRHPIVAPVLDKLAGVRVLPI